MELNRAKFTYLFTDRRCERCEEARKFLRWYRESLTSSLLYGVEKTHRRACFASTKAPANNVSSHFEGENGAGEKSGRRSAERRDGKGPFNGESSGFCNITAGTTLQLQRITQRSLPLFHPPVRRENHGEVCRPCFAQGRQESDPFLHPPGSERGSVDENNNARNIRRFIGSAGIGAALARCLRSSNYRDDVFAALLCLRGSNDRP